MYSFRTPSIPDAQSSQSGFTLLELIIVIAILSILSVAVVLVINPAEMLKRARDTQRLSDLAALNTALNLVQLEEDATFNPNEQEADGCADEAFPLVYVSVPDDVETAPDDLPAGWGYKQQATSADASLIDSSGWLPVNINNASGGAPISHLPLDPINTFADNLYYTYVCNRNPHFELTARLESTRYGVGGNEDKLSGDGGDDPFVYEIGTDISIDPKAPVGYWALDESGGTVAYDTSGNGNDGTYAGNTGLFTFGQSGVRGTSVQFDRDPGATNNGPHVNLGILMTNPVDWTYAAWVYLDVDQPPVTAGLVGEQNAPRLALTTTIREVQVGLNFEAGGGWAGSLNTTVASTGVWYHMVVTVQDADTATPVTELYIDGQLVGTKNNYGAAVDDPDSTHYLNYRDGHEVFEGRLDEVAIYDRALTAEEISAIYDMTKP